MFRSAPCAMAHHACWSGCACCFWRRLPLETMTTTTTTTRLGGIPAGRRRAVQRCGAQKHPTAKARAGSRSCGSWVAVMTLRPGIRTRTTSKHRATSSRYRPPRLNVRRAPMYRHHRRCPPNPRRRRRRRCPPRRRQIRQMTGTARLPRRLHARTYGLLMQAVLALRKRGSG